jgi:hypothetical protein
MHILLDKLGASIVAATIFLMVFNVNINNKQTMNETTAFYTLTRQTENLAKILRRDLQGIESVITISETALAGGITQFSFVSRIGQDTTKQTIVYRKVPASSDEGIQFYNIERLVNGVANGGSSNIITDWKIEALNEDAGAITDPDDTAQIYVRFEAALPHIETKTVESIRWESRFFPPLRNS